MAYHGLVGFMEASFAVPWLKLSLHDRLFKKAAISNNGGGDFSTSGPKIVPVDTLTFSNITISETEMPDS